MAPVSAEVPATLKFDHATMSDIAQALASGQVNATALTKGYLARIEAYAYEQASDMRKVPPGLRALEPNLLSSRACRQARALRRDAQKSSDVCSRGETAAHGSAPGMSPCGPGAELRAELD
ncbi:hypothetical protein [Bradyrhizobium sp. USDA 329]|uniref:hypothetical protein n=1 Tax=Bradyrhizobium sp. USDA 329 TaxID=3156310 RepID=UPI0035179786